MVLSQLVLNWRTLQNTLKSADASFGGRQNLWGGVKTEYTKTAKTLIATFGIYLLFSNLHNFSYPYLV